MHRGLLIDRPTRARRIRTQRHRQPRIDQVETGLQHADVCLDPRDHDALGLELLDEPHHRLRAGREPRLRVDAHRRVEVLGDLLHRRPQASRVLLGDEQRQLERVGPLQQPAGAADQRRLLVHVRHDPLLQIHQNHGGTVGLKSHEV